MNNLPKPFELSLRYLLDLYGQSEKRSIELITSISQLFEKSAEPDKSVVSNSIKKEVIKRLTALLRFENFKDIKFKDGFLQEKIQTFTDVLNAKHLQSTNVQNRDIAYVDLVVHRAIVLQSFLDKTRNKSTISAFFANKGNKYYQFLIERFFDQLKKVIEKFINEESNLIKKRPIDINQNLSTDSSRIVVKNDALIQRRMDALARLFNSDSIKAPCIAIALVKGHLIIGVNTPSVKNNVDEEMNSIKKQLFKKATILQSHFISVKKAFKNNTNTDFEKKLELISKYTFQKLQSRGFSSRFHYSNGVIQARFKMDLDKITRSFLKNLKKNKGLDFSNEEIEILLAGKPLILFPDQAQEERLGCRMHADQVVLIAILKALKGEDMSRLTQITAPLKRISMDGILPKRAIPIGLPKLSCAGCFANIYQYRSLVSCTGTSGFFLNKSMSTHLTLEEIIELMNILGIINSEVSKEFKELNFKDGPNTSPYHIKAEYVSKVYATHVIDVSSSGAESGNFTLQNAGSSRTRRL